MQALIAWVQDTHYPLWPGSHFCDLEQLDRFNALVHRFNARHPGVRAAQLDLLAQCLLDHSAPPEVLEIVRTRCYQADLAAHLIDDPLWKPRPALLPTLREFRHWLIHEPKPIGPRREEWVGLDEALLMESAQAPLETEILDYADYLSLKAELSAREGVPESEFALDPRDWVRHRCMNYRRAHDSYVPGAYFPPSPRELRVV